MAIPQTGNGPIAPRGPHGDYDPEGPDGRPEEIVPSRRGNTDGVDEHDPSLADFFRGTDRKLGLKDILNGLRGNNIDWYHVMQEPGGMDRLLEAANDPNHPDHKSAKAYMQSEEGARAVAQQMQKNARFDMLLSNLEKAMHDIMMNTIRNTKV